MSRYRSLMGWRVSRFFFAALLLTLACAGAAHADTFQVGQFVTYDQGAWKNVSAATTILTADFASVYAPSGGFVTVGSNTGLTMKFADSSFILIYLPAGGPPAPLTSSVVDPAATSAGSFGGDVLALALNIDFSNAGFLAHPAGTPFGNLVLQNMVDANLDGLTVSQFLADANTCLGGGVCVDSVANLDADAADLNLAFEAGTPSSFAQTNLALPTSATVPEPSSILLLGTGLLGLGAVRLRRRRSASSVMA